MRFPILTYLPKTTFYNKDEISFISHETLASLRIANQYYQTLPQRFLGLSGKSLASYQQCMLLYADNRDSAKFHHTARQYQLDQDKLKLQRWREAQRKQLNEPLFWENLYQDNLNKQLKYKTSTLKNRWVKYQRLAHFSSSALLEIAQKILPLFENYSEMVRNELEYYRKNLSASFLRTAGVYLVNLNKEIQKERQELCENMLLRLQIISESGLAYFDEPILYFKLKLTAHNVNQYQKEMLSHISHQFKEQDFLKFHHYILKHGSNKQIDELFSCLWLQNNQDYLVRKNFDTALIIPKDLQHHIKDNMISRIFSGFNFFKSILQKNFVLLSQIRLLDNMPKSNFNLQNFDLESNWQYLQSITQTIIKQYNYIDEKIPKSFFARFFLKDRLRFLNDWKIFLRQQHHKVFQKKIAYANSVSEQIKTRILFNLDNSLLTSSHFSEDLQNFINDMQNDINHLDMNKESSSTWEQSLQLFNCVINKNFSNLELPTTKDSHAINDAHEQTQNYAAQEEKQENIFAMKDFSEYKSLPNEIQEILIRAGSDLKPPKYESFSLLLNQLNDALTNTKSEDCFNKKNIKPFISNIFLNYLKIATEFLSFEELLQFHETSKINLFFESFAPAYIRKRFIDLNKSCNRTDWVIFQTKCHATMASLDDPKMQSCLIDKLILSISEIQPKNLTAQEIKSAI